MPDLLALIRQKNSVTSGFVINRFRVSAYAALDAISQLVKDGVINPDGTVKKYAKEKE